MIFNYPAGYGPGDNVNFNTVTASNVQVNSTDNNSIVTQGRIQYSNSVDGTYGNIFAATTSGNDSIYLSHFSNGTMDIQWQFYTSASGYGTLRYYDATAGSWKTPFWNALASRTANTVLAAPTASDGSATFRKLQESDLPLMNIFSSSVISGLTKQERAAGYSTSINNTTSAYTSSGTTGWSYLMFGDTYIAAGFISVTCGTGNIAVSTAFGSGYTNSSDRYFRLPMDTANVISCIFGTTYGGGNNSGVTAILRGSLKNYIPSSGHVYSLPFRVFSPTSISSTATAYTNRIPVLIVGRFS